MNELKNQPDHEQNHDEDQNFQNQENPEENPAPVSEQPDKPEPVISPVAAAFIGLIGGFFLYQVLGGLLTLLVFGFDFEKNADVNGIRLMTMAGQILFILLPALVFSRMFYHDVGPVIRAKMPDFKEIALFTFGIIILTPLLQSFINIQNYYVDIWAANSETIRQVKSFFDSVNEVVEKTYGNLLSANNVFEGIFVVAAVAVVPAVCEEVMFRGFIQKSFEYKLKPFRAALITAVFFGIYHFNPYGVVPLIALGFYFGFAAYMSNSIVVPIILHFFNNFTAVMLYFLIGNEDFIKSKTTEPVELGFSVFMFASLLLVFAGVIILIRRYYSQLRNV